MKISLYLSREEAREVYTYDIITNINLHSPLKAKFKAWVGKYLMRLATFPRQKERNPCSL